MKRFADLHIHTTASDGEYSPQAVVQAAKAQGFTAIAITDHDTLSGLKEAEDACLTLGIELISGIEISTVWCQKEIHVLGYLIDNTDQKFLDKLKEMKTSRRERIEKMVVRLNELGFKISLDKVQKVAGTGAIGRPHVAKVLMEENYVKSMKEAFIKLLSPGCPAYIPRYKITPHEAIKMIRAVEGIPVIAHPGINPDDDIIYQLVEEGLLGIEVWHPEHTPSLVKKYYELAKRCGLLVTGGSDWHGNNKEGSALGKIKIDYKYVEELKSKKHEILRISNSNV